jgi:UDP-N-acetylglucosamine--N-acetylmuramyl-(pentapeptide) pyrophosphoryl-undecaprenol N-acetylglucosamine transferase
MVKDSDAMTELVPAVTALAKDDKKQNELRENIGRYAIVDADVRIAKEIIRLLDDKR